MIDVLRFAAGLAMLLAIAGLARGDRKLTDTAELWLLVIALVVLLTTGDL